MADEEIPKQETTQDEVKKEAPKAMPEAPKITPKPVAAHADKVVKDPDDDLSEFDDVDGHESFGDVLVRVIGAAGIRKGNLLGCGVVLLVVIGIGLFFMLGGWNKVTSLFSSGASEAPPPAIVLEPRDITSSDLVTAYYFGVYPTPESQYPSSMELAYKFGGSLPIAYLVVPPQESGLTMAYRFGFRGYTYDRIELYIDNIREIQSALTTDVNAALNQSTDRRAALTRLIADFDALADRSTENAGLVTKEVLTAQSQVAPITSRVTLLQNDFNTNLAAFFPRETRLNLEEFIAASKEQAEVKANLGAFTKIDKYYQIANVKLAARIKDLKANFEALAKGVKVFDIKNSDLDIIKYEGTPPSDTIPAPLNRASTGGSTFGVPIDFASGIHN
jgi:hypothetical protein